MSREERIRKRMQEAYKRIGSLRGVANMPEYEGIPFSTIGHIIKGGDIPDKHRKKLGIDGPEYPRSERPPKLEIRKDDPAKAAKSILKNIGDEFASQLIVELIRQRQRR